MIELLVILAVLLAVAVFVTVPLRGDHAAEAERREQSELADLEAAKEAKYHEIRDAELDYRTGKLSEEDWRALDRGLRAEAIALLRRLDELAPGHRPDAVG